MGIRKRQQKSNSYRIPNLGECHGHRSTAVTSPRTYKRNKVGKASLFTPNLTLPLEETAYSLWAAPSSWGSRISAAVPPSISLSTHSSSQRGLTPFCRLAGAFGFCSKRWKKSLVTGPFQAFFIILPSLTHCRHSQGCFTKSTKISGQLRAGTQGTYPTK